MMRKLLLISLLLFPILLQAQFERPGSSTGKFLNIGVSPRAEAMGSAYISLVNNAEAAYYNPAVLAQLQHPTIAFSHNEWLAGIKHDFFAISYKLSEYDGLAFSATSLTTDEMKVRTPLQPNGTGETFRVANYRFGLSYGRMLTNWVRVGVTLNYIHFGYFRDFEKGSFSADVSAIYVTEFHDFSFGMKISNFGTSIKFVNEEYPLPQTFTFGLSFDALESEEYKLMISLAADKQNDSQTLLQGGLEWNFRDILFLRGGYKLNHDVAKYSFGAGVQSVISGILVNFDYSFSEYGEIGNAHRFGVGIGIL